MINPQTRTCIRLLGPCFKTGQMKYQSHAMPNAPQRIRFAKGAQPSKRHQVKCQSWAWSRQTMNVPSCSTYWHHGLVVTCKARHTMRIKQPRMPNHVHRLADICTLQSCYNQSISFAFISATSGTSNFLFKVLFTFPSWYLYTIGLKPIFSFGWSLPPNLRSTSKERDSWKHTLYERLHMTRRSFTFIAAFFQKACMHTFIGNASILCKSKPEVQVVNMSYSLFIRHY